MYDCIIAGAGIIGASCAMNLAKAGYKVAIVDKSEPCSGASGACNGGISYLGKTGKNLLESIESLKIYQKLEEELNEDLEIDQSKSMILLGKNEADEEILNKLVNACLNENLPAELLIGRKLKNYLTDITSEVTCAAVAPGGLQGVVNPFKVTYAYLQKAKQLGTDIFLGRYIQGLNVEGGIVKGIHTEEDDILGDIFINCAGIEVDDIWKKQNIFLDIYPLKGIVLVSQPYPRLYPGNVLNVDFMKKNSSEISLAVEQTKAGNLLIGSSKVKGDRSNNISNNLSAKIAKNAMSYLENLKDINMIRFFTGHRPSRDDGYYIGKIKGLNNVYAAAGFGGTGITMAPFAGRKILDEIYKG